MAFDWNNLPRPIIALSPMADMTDSAFCQTVKEVGSPILFREMVSAEALVRANEKTMEMVEFVEAERPIIQQIFGSDPDTMAKAAQIVEQTAHPEGIDINMGCPVYKLTSSFNGAALMKNPELATQIIQKVKVAITCPLSVKIRAGWDDPEECIAFAKVVEAAGADLITIHGRTKAQAYAGYSDWGIIKRVKEAVSIPVLANGDIFSADDAQRALAVTGADGVLVARGALGNPWIFPQIVEQLTTGTIATRPTVREHFELVLRHAKRHVEQYGEQGLVTFRKHLSWYTKGMQGAKEVRSSLVRIHTFEELTNLLQPFLQDNRPMELQRLASLQPESYD
ncbi:tRNA dihydrouridine synthase DusB [Candidatus Uhrbacteria bacterium CG10_big_fil_rev_8_21_14_0_10_50_16]|uniref:tRNA-dihydrouridine synthase n=1 Tax=Candidatus Uhrbacteria bacterium CG10_big_fil_rev_8_21_14_0_10_50_16 TaxID=1975039 RepID=A0A2H0RPR4_9BACT|nr:MAG: tRNA dihydrouridine synthase DusB [Candidatus Uhrbacteria bacterium CG10_big_fil_rev_8_21_14_0_10_50_16]